MSDRISVPKSEMTTGASQGSIVSPGSHAKSDRHQSRRGGVKADAKATVSPDDDFVTIYFHFAQRLPAV